MTTSVSAKFLGEPLWKQTRRVGKAGFSTTLGNWLFDQSSLTRRLQKHCPGQFRVHVQSQRRQRILFSEAHCLGISPRQLALVRQVHLFCGDNAVVFARTVIPMTSLVGKQRRLARLGDRSLGAVLFADKSMHRSAVEITRIGPRQQLHDSALRYSNRKRQPVWGRRSVFVLNGHPLLVSEFFLPALLDPVHERGA